MQVVDELDELVQRGLLATGSRQASSGCDKQLLGQGRKGPLVLGKRLIMWNVIT